MYRQHGILTSAVLILLSIICLNGQNYKKIGHLPEGLFDGIWCGSFLVCDANGNGYPEFYYYMAFGSRYGFTRIREYRPFNRYVCVDSLHLQIAQYVGDLDGDDKADLLTHDEHGSARPTVFESPSPDTYPTQMVWQSDSTHSPTMVWHVDDLDQDGRMDFLVQRSSPLWIYENTGDNQYDIVWFKDGFNHSNFTSGDFDLDGRMEFITPTQNVGAYQVYECVGDNTYRVVWIDTTHIDPNSNDIVYGDDLDQDGKPEFIISSNWLTDGSRLYFRVYESVGDNQYECVYTSDDVFLPGWLTSWSSSSGDVDLDGQDEFVWAVPCNWFIYKAFGNNNFQRVFTAYPANNSWSSTDITVCDVNGNGYPEIIESCSDLDPQGSSATTIWEIEAVRLLYPNGGEVFHPQDTVEVNWQTFDPPGCDSLSLFFSSDSGYNYDIIVTGIPGSETTYQWIVPDTTSDECMLMIWAYGPGIGWDFTDSTFAISVGVAEERSKKLRQELKVYPNPASGPVNVDLPSDVEEISLLDATGRQVKKLQPSPKLTLNLPPGIYFLRFRTLDLEKTEKLVVVR